MKHSAVPVNPVPTFPASSFRPIISRRRKVVHSLNAEGSLQLYPEKRAARFPPCIIKADSETPVLVGSLNAFSSPLATQKSSIELTLSLLFVQNVSHPSITQTFYLKKRNFRDQHVAGIEPTSCFHVVMLNSSITR